MSTLRDRGTWKPGDVRLVERPGEIVSPLELRELSDDELVRATSN